MFSADDRRHGDADALFGACIRGRVRLVTSQLVLAEVHRLLLFAAGIKAAATAIMKIESSPSTTIEHPSRAHHDRAMHWLAALDDQVISYTDAVSFALMESARCDVALTFDADFTIAGFTQLQLALLGPPRRR